MAVFNKPEFNSVWAATGTKVAPGVAKIGVGWVVEIPPHEYANWLENRRDAMLAHLNQAGIPYWDATVEYQASKSYIQGVVNGIIYRCLVTNIGVNPELDIQGNWEVAFQRSGEALLKSQNLADVPDKAQARVNLGIVTTADYDARYLIKGQNLADVPNKATARGNLGLGNSATLNTGTTANTVASGNDSRIVGAVQTSREVTAGNGLSGGGNLSADRTISLGTPSAITATSTNSVTSTSHSHSVDLASIFPTTWTDVTTSRTHSTPYRNPTTKLMFVSITGRNASGTGRYIQVSTDGIVWTNVGRLGAGDDIEGVCVPVPGRNYYRVDGSSVIGSWAELT